MELNDSEILLRFRRKADKEEAFSLLVRKYQERLYWQIRKIVIIHEDADDVLQNVFLKVWEKLSDFREDSMLFTWLYRIAVNESLSFLRKKSKTNNVQLESLTHQYAENLENDSLFSGDELQLKLQKAVLLLPEKQRLVFNMKYFDDMKYEDIAEVLGTSTGALKASYHHAVKKIKQYFEIE